MNLLTHLDILWFEYGDIIAFSGMITIFAILFWFVLDR